MDCGMKHNGLILTLTLENRLYDNILVQSIKQLYTKKAKPLK